MIISPVWSDNFPLVAAIVAAVLYQLGGRQQGLLLISSAGVSRLRSIRRRWRSIAFYAALAVMVFALQPPMDGWADDLFWAHMIQHQLVLMVAAPLLIIAAPWLRIWSGFPLRFRRPLARSVLQDPWAAPLRTLGHVLGSPQVAWVLFNAILIGWHIPYLYDAAVSNQVVHDAEHATFLLFALVFWGQLIDSSPFRSRLDYMHRFFYMAASMFPSWILALVMVFSGAPLYPVYVVIEAARGGPGVLADQQIGGAIMWMVGSIPMAITGFWLIYQWVATTQEPQPQRRRRPAADVVAVSEPPVGT
jgi:putative membrane protein